MNSKDKIVISAVELAAWKADTYKIYTSQMWAGKLLRLKVNLSGAYLVTHGNDTLYFGSDLSEAKRVWREA